MSAVNNTGLCSEGDNDSDLTVRAEVSPVK